MKNKSFIRWAKISLALVYLVIIAGATVRMTGSGMGCPDWPKCFGYYIPPTEEAELMWKTEHEYKKGQVIIKEEKLWVAKEDFTSTTTYEPKHWDEYTKHDYAVFNPYHTWVEYINRLCGALAGLACLVLFVQSFTYWSHKKSVVLWAGIVLFLLGFNAWLGATVVYSVLNPVRITIHMIAALINVAALIYLTRIAQPEKQYQAIYDKKYHWVAWIALIFTLIQIGLGTQVRQFIDEQTRSGVTDVMLWLQNPDVNFYVHRTFSFVILFVNLYLFLRNKRLGLGSAKINWVMILLLLEILTGVLMYYIHFPFGTQAAHLVLAALMFGLQFALVLEANKKSQKSV